MTESKSNDVIRCPMADDLNVQRFCVGFGMHPNGESCEYLSDEGECASAEIKRTLKGVPLDEL